MTSVSPVKTCPSWMIFSGSISTLNSLATGSPPLGSNRRALVSCHFHDPPRMGKMEAGAGSSTSPTLPCPSGLSKRMSKYWRFCRSTTTSNTDTVSPPWAPARILTKAAEMGARKAKADMDTNDRASARIAMSFPDHFRRKSAVILDGSFSREAGDGSGIGVSPEAIGDAETMVPRTGCGVSCFLVSDGGIDSGLPPLPGRGDGRGRERRAGEVRAPPVELRFTARDVDLL